MTVPQEWKQVLTMTIFIPQMTTHSCMFSVFHLTNSNQWKHMIFIFWDRIFSRCKSFQWNLFSCTRQGFTLLHGWKASHNKFRPRFLYLLISQRTAGLIVNWAVMHKRVQIALVHSHLLWGDLCSDQRNLHAAFPMSVFTLMTVLINITISSGLVLPCTNYN